MNGMHFDEGNILKNLVWIINLKIRERFLYTN